MRILMLTQWFDPEPAFKGLVFARELAARGHEVEVLTGFPNYPGGDVYPGYRIRPWTREMIDGVSVVRVALYPSHSKSSFGRVLNYGTFAVSAALLGTVLIRKPDIIYVYHPPATVGLAAVAIGFLHKSPFVFDVQDLWPDTLSATGMVANTALLKFIGRCCRFIYSRAQHITVDTPGFKARLISRGVPADKIDVIYNWCDEDSVKSCSENPELSASLGYANCFNVLFAGTMGMAQALDSVLESAALCRQSVPNARFLFVGGGVDRARLERKAAALALTNVLFLPRQPMSAMGPVLALADVLLVHLRNDPLFAITIPSKTQAYLASRKPVLMAVRGDAADLITQSGGGLICEPENPAAMAEAIARFAEMTPDARRRISTAGGNYYDLNLSLKVGVTKFEVLFARICGTPCALGQSRDGSATPRDERAPRMNDQART